jgi:hypothetical protein
MNRLLSIGLAVLVLSPLFAQESSVTGNINGYLGAKFLDEDDWSPVENQGAIGAMFDIRGRNWPISIAVNAVFSSDEDEEGAVDSTGGTAELQLGVKKIWDFPAKFHLAVSGGLAIVSAAVEVDTGVAKTDDDDSAVGGWLAVDPYWTFGSFNLGPHIALSSAEVTIFGEDIQAGGLHLGVVMGYHW